ncbi:hypothetical protein ACK8HY_08015 [Sphingobacterium sp. NGMCC 1.201703]|uniref:hypothetical protein n=1 Tax=Sphingobacterium sp. NGMCC 1.201703 TaxID=3388657 RepID=UPI0039FC7C8A
MDVICKKCGHVHQFKIEVTDFSGFVCANCHSYFKGSTLETLTYVKEFSAPLMMQWASLGELVRFKKNSYWIITKIQRYSKNGEYGNEFVGLNANREDIYFSDGVDYACALHTVEREKVMLLPQSNICKFNNVKYNLEYTEEQTVVYAEGFVFEDLESPSTTNTYIQVVNEDRFISQEFIDNDVQYYQGIYLDDEDYYQIFDIYKSYTAQKEIAGTKLRNIGIFAVLLLAVLFWFLNWGQIGKDEYKFDEKFFAKKTNSEFVGASFELKGDKPKKLVLEGISESKNHPIQLMIKLVNEKTNEIIETGTAVHDNNDINYASGLTVDFCRIQPGVYHLVFVTSSSNGSTDMAVNFELNEDYKLTYGGTSYVFLITCLVGLVVLVGIFRHNMLAIKNKDFVARGEGLSYVDILKFDWLGVALIAFFAFFIAVSLFVNSSTNCRTTLRTSTLEDHTYTGSRSHYYRSFYGSGGSYSGYGSGHK